MPIRKLSLLRNGFLRSRARHPLPGSNCHIHGDRIIVLKEEYDCHGGFSAEIGSELNFADSDVEIGKNILDLWSDLEVTSGQVPRQRKDELLNDIAMQLGFASSDELWKETHLVSVGGGVKEHSKIIDEYAHIMPWRAEKPGVFKEGVGVEFVCRREPELVGRFVKKSIDLVRNTELFDEEIRHWEKRDQLESRMRWRWAKLKHEKGKSGEAREMAAHFSVGQRVRHTESDREGVVIRVDRKHHDGQGLVEAELEDGEIIKSMLILPWIEPLETASTDDAHDNDLDEGVDMAEEDRGFHIGQKVVHVVSGRNGIVRRVDSEAEHGMGVIEVELEDGEVVLTSCIAPGLEPRT